MRYTLFSLLILLGLMLSRVSGADVSEKLLSNVSYSSVLALDVDKPYAKIPYGDDSLQFGELWLPKDRPKNVPLVIFIHGGCWLNAFDIRHADALGTALSQQGYAVWSLEYRRTGDQGGGWPGSYTDIVAGIQFAQQLERYSVDLTRVILSGHSAGGHLALLASADKTVAKQVKGVIGLAAISDLKTYSLGDNSCQKATQQFMGGSWEKKPDAFVKADPRKQMLHRNTVLIHGDHDTIVPISQSSGSDITLKTVVGAGHFDLIHPGTLAWKTFLDTLNELTKN